MAAALCGIVNFSCGLTFAAELETSIKQSQPALPSSAQSPASQPPTSRQQLEAAYVALQSSAHVDDATRAEICYKLAKALFDDRQLKDMPRIHDLYSQAISLLPDGSGYKTAAEHALEEITVSGELEAARRQAAGLPIEEEHTRRFRTQALLALHYKWLHRNVLWHALVQEELKGKKVDDAMRDARQIIGFYDQVSAADKRPIVLEGSIFTHAAWKDFSDEGHTIMLEAAERVRAVAGSASLHYAMQLLETLKYEVAMKRFEYASKTIDDLAHLVRQREIKADSRDDWKSYPTDCRAEELKPVPRITLRMVLRAVVEVVTVAGRTDWKFAKSAYSKLESAMHKKYDRDESRYMRDVFQSIREGKKGPQAEPFRQPIGRGWGPFGTGGR